LIGAGTNNSRLAGNLRYLASYYANSPDQLFVVRIAQGLVHMGKGLMGLNPLHSDKFLFSNVSLAGLITILYTCTDMKTFLCGKYHYFLYYLVLSMYPRMLITVTYYSLLIYLLVERELGAYPNLSACGHVS
jgi:26S proteasome regulatory subunit N1